MDGCHRNLVAPKITRFCGNSAALWMQWEFICSNHNVGFFNWFRLPALLFFRTLQEFNHCRGQSNECKKILGHMALRFMTKTVSLRTAWEYSCFIYCWRESLSPTVNFQAKNYFQYLKKMVLYWGLKLRPNDSNILTQHIPTLLAQHLQAPAKRSQHLNATDRNIVGCNILRAFGHHVVMCCGVLPWSNIVARTWPNDCNSIQHPEMLREKFEPTTPDMSQHVATGWPNARNILHPTMLRCVALKGCDRLAGA